MPDSPIGEFSDSEMQRLFQALREHVVEVADDFSRRVLFRVQSLIEERSIGGPSLSEIVEDTSVETVNVVVRGIKAGVEAPERAEQSEQSTPGDDADHEG